MLLFFNGTLPSFLRHCSAASWALLTSASGRERVLKKPPAKHRFDFNGQGHFRSHSYSASKMLLAGYFLMSCQRTAPVLKPSGFLHTGVNGASPRTSPAEPPAMHRCSCTLRAVLTLFGPLVVCWQEAQSPASHIFRRPASG